jgi:Mg-chelatase subunit ChlD
VDAIQEFSIQTHPVARARNQDLAYLDYRRECQPQRDLDFPAEEVQRTASLLCELRSTEFLVVDTEKKSGLVRTGSARVIAEQLGATYVCIEDLKSESLASLVQSRTANAAG